MVEFYNAQIEPHWQAESGNTSFGRYAKKISTKFNYDKGSNIFIKGTISKYDSIGNGELTRILDDRSIKLVRSGLYKDGRAGGFKYEIDLTPTDIKSIINEAILNDIVVLSPLVQKILQESMERKLLRNETLELLNEVTEINTDEIFRYELSQDKNFRKSDEYKKSYKSNYSDIENEFKFLKNQTPLYFKQQVDIEAEKIRNKMFSSLTEEDVEIEVDDMDE